MIYPQETHNNIYNETKHKNLCTRFVGHAVYKERE